MNKFPIYVINRAADRLRRSNISQLCDNYGINVIFVSAIEGDSIQKESLRFFDQSAVKKYGQLSNGELGCALSHISVYHMIINQKLPWGIVLEDDASFDSHFLSFIELIPSHPEDLELLLLGYYSHTKTQRSSLPSVWRQHYLSDELTIVRLSELAYGTHGYFITNKGAQKLLDTLTVVDKPIDHYTGVDTYLNMYAIKPRVINLHPVDSLTSSITRNNLIKHKIIPPAIQYKCIYTILFNIYTLLKRMFNSFRYIKKYKL